MCIQAFSQAVDIEVPSIPESATPSHLIQVWGEASLVGLLFIGELNVKCERGTGHGG